ncbi:hypothetical protein [Actinomadura kijaniata]|uniref:hypothetical protein n=1 Tax=Actinomadura kijaniata TaxID=46161 RepID=UPI000B0D122B|nr:hypothetical protein [Actinomadura kijaniata]
MAVQNDADGRRPSRLRRRAAMALVVATGVAVSAVIPQPPENPVTRITHSAVEASR